MDWKGYATRIVLSPLFWMGAVKLADSVVFAIWPNFPVKVADNAQYFILGLGTIITGVQLNNERKMQARLRAVKAKAIANG